MVDSAVNGVKEFPSLSEETFVDILSLKVTRLAKDRPRDASL
jgi:hypothetical protein